MTDRKPIETVHELVEFFGGDTAMAEFFGTTQTVVGQWKCRKAIATGWHLRILAEVRRRGATIDPMLFGLTEEDAAVLFNDSRPFAKRRVEARA